MKSLRQRARRFGPGVATRHWASSRAARHPGLRRDYERWLRQPLPAELAQCRAPIGLEAGDVRTRRGDAERERLPPVLERGVLDVHRDGAVDDVADSSRAKEVGQVAGPAAGADRPSLDLGSSAWAASQNGPIGPPSVKSHTHAATTPPSRVTRAISRRPATGSSMTLTASWASVASKQPPSNGRSSAGARMTWTPGWRARRAATNSSDGPTAVTRPGPALRASSAVSAPGPHPTSRTRPSSGSPAKSAEGTASGPQKRPLNRAQ